MEPNAVSFNPADAVAGGSLIDDCEATLISLRSCLFDYQGKIPAPIVALHAQWQYLVDGHPQVAHEYYSAGDTKNLAPSQDGRQLIPVGSQGGINDSCNAYKLMVSFINGGFNQPIGKDLAIFDGSRCYVKRVVQPKVAGATKDSRPLLVQKYLGVGQVLPMAAQAAAPGNMGQGAMGAGAGPVMGGMMGGGAAPGFAQPPAMGLGQPMAAGFGQPAQAMQAPQAYQQPVAQAPVQQFAPAPAAPAAPAADPMVGKAAQALVQLLASKGGTIPKAQIPGLAFAALASDPDRNTLVQLMFTDQFLGIQGAPWKFDGQNVSLG